MIEIGQHLHEDEQEHHENTEKNRYKQILAFGSVHFLALFILIYVGYAYLLLRAHYKTLTRP